MSLLVNAVAALASGGTVVVEFNTLASPTAPRPRKVMEEALGVVEKADIEILPLAGHQPPGKMVESLRRPGDREFDVPAEDETSLRPSTWQDLHLGRGRTEVEFLNGEIVRLGEKHGVATPLNSLMVRVVNKMAAEKLKPGAYTPADLREML